MGIFDDIYKNNHWGFGSGNGSLPSVTKSYRKFLEDFIRENDIKQAVDYGCGDWQFSQLIDWGQARYTGLDIVKEVVTANKKQFQTAKVKFQVIKPDAVKLPPGDLLITKDVLQHLSDKSVKLFLTKVVPKYKYVLITNCNWPEETLNDSIATGEFRPLDVRLAPFNSPGAVVHTFQGRKAYVKNRRSFLPAWRKSVILIQN